MSVFSSVRGNQVGRSVFNLSHVKRFTCDMGELVPALVLECVPGDTFKIGADVVTRFQPLVAPILDSVDMTVHYFFVPSRLLFDDDKDWETFLTGGKDGTDTSVSLPVYGLGNFDGGTSSNPQFPFSSNIRYGKYSLWDYLGLPVPTNDSDGSKTVAIRDANHISGLIPRAYTKIWNEYYRDENLVDEASMDNDTILFRSWRKDYFTSSLPWQQRGISPALPVSGIIPVDNLTGSSIYIGTNVDPVRLLGNYSNGDLGSTRIGNTSGSNLSTIDTQSINPYYRVQGKISFDRAPSVNLNNGTTFNIAVLREAMQVQRWLELNARGGVLS